MSASATPDDDNPLLAPSEEVEEVEEAEVTPLDPPAASTDDAALPTADELEVPPLAVEAPDVPSLAAAEPATQQPVEARPPLEAPPTIVPPAVGDVPWGSETPAQVNRRDETPLPEPKAAPHPVAAASLGTGDLLGQWVIDSPIGVLQGCQLFRAHHKNTERIRVVLKVLCQDPAENPNLVREGELLFALKHPNVASVRNLKLTHQPPFLEMDELPGDRLDQLLERQQVFMAQALDLVEQLLGALVYLHARDVYHRDIRPQNVMVRQNGVLTLMGFAYASQSPGPDEQAPLTSLGYLPPEWPTVTQPAQADLYAAGCLLFELLTGHPPFDAPARGSALTMAAVLHRKTDVPYLDPGDRFHEDLRAVVRMLTNAEPRGRFPSAATALGRLQRVERSYST